MDIAPKSKSARAANVRRSSAKKRRHRHLLDTGMRSSEADRQRLRRGLAFCAKVFIAAAALAGGYFGIRSLVARTILQNERYNISELNVETDGVLKPEEILDAADLHKGVNIFQVDLARTQARVAAIPQVEKVSVSRQLPSRISVQIVERKPVAWLSPTHGTSTRDEVIASKFSWFVDANGVFLRPKQVSAQDRYLPIIRNYGEGPFSEGQEATGEDMKAALDLLRAQEESANTARFQIQEIDLARRFGLMVTDRNGMQVLFGLDEMDRQLKRLDVYLQALDQRGQKPQSINLLVERNVPVTFAMDTIVTDKPVAAPTQAPSASGSAGAAKDKPTTKEKATLKPKSHGPDKAADASHGKTNPQKGQPFINGTTDASQVSPAPDKH